MDIKKLNEDQGSCWEYVPDINTLLEYLGRKDLVELSKCCKRYRKQLEPKVLEKLTLSTWRGKNLEVYFELKDSKNIKKTLKYIKTDLGTKIKFVKKFTLDCDIDYHFAKKFVKLLPNIKTLRFNENHEMSCDIARSIIAVLKGMKRLEHAEFNYYWAPLRNYYHRKQIFPNSLKSLKVCNNKFYFSNENSLDLKLYDKIDSKYNNLNFISITSNIMLQNLSFGMPSLQKAAVLNFELFDKSKLCAFLKANPQLKIIDTKTDHINEELIKTILASKSLESWYISSGNWNETTVKILSSNYSIKHIIINNYIPASVVMKLANSCKLLEIFEFKHYSDINEIDWLKLERRVNILKLTYFNLTPSCFKKIDSSRIFNTVRLKVRISIEKFIERFKVDKLENYIFIPLVSGSCILKLINN
jgi:hypothetical protein